MTTVPKLTRQEATAKVIELLARRGVQAQTAQLLLLIDDLVNLLAPATEMDKWPTDEMGREIDPQLIHLKPLIVKGYNDDTADDDDTRPCLECGTDRRVVREYTTDSRQDPTAAYVLECGHHTIDL